MSSSDERIHKEALDLERQAHSLLSQHQHEEAYEINKKAAFLFTEIKKYEEAGFCFRKAASCWEKHIGQLPLYKAARSHESAAEEFVKVKRFELAMHSYADAAVLYEKEGNYAKYSYCFYESKTAQGRHDWHLFLTGENLPESFFLNIWERVKALGRKFMNSHNAFLWGYGERPFRTLRAAILLVLTSAAAYTFWGPVQTPHGIRSVNFVEGLYLSAITFSTVGYGDYMPLSLLARGMAVFEGLSGIILMPLFLVGMTRRYLRSAS